MSEDTFYIQKWAVGLLIIGHIVDENLDDIDVSGATVKQLIFIKPSGIKIVVAAEFNTDGVDGRLKFTTTAGWLDEGGWWELSAWAVTPSREIPTTSYRFFVSENIYAGDEPNTIGELPLLELTSLLRPTVAIGD